MRFRVSVAESRADILRCQYFIAEIYNREFGIMFSEDIYDLDARVEPYPHRYLMGTVDGELVAAVGLYLTQTYIERYGGVTDADILEQLEKAGVAHRYAPGIKREPTKLVVKRGWEHYGLGRRICYAAHSRAFLEGSDPRPTLVVTCAKLSILRHIFTGQPPDHDPKRIRTRFLKPFPFYEVHAQYRSATDPMETRLIIPSLDIPAPIFEQTLPFEVTLDEKP